MAVVSSAIYYGLSVFFVSEAERKLQNVLYSQRGLHLYIQKIMHPTFYKARDAGLIAQNYYAPEIFSSSFIVRNTHALYNEEIKKHGLPEVYYKMATVNPRNPVNQADADEASLIRFFNENRQVHEVRKLVSINDRKYLYYAIPFLETNPACLRCHGKREDAPPGLQVLYPGEGGFNEKAGVYRAIESIRMPINDEMSSVWVISAALTFGFATTLILFFFNKQLQTVVGDKTSSLEAEIAEHKQAESALKRANTDLQRFAEVTAHHLQEPARRMATYAKHLSEQLGDRIDDEARQSLQFIDQQARRQQSLLHDVERYLAADQARGEIRSLDTGKNVREILSRMSDRISESGAEIILEDLPSALLDAPRLNDMFSMGLDNALYHGRTEKGLRITISGVRDDKRVRYSISDNGPGIDAQYREQVFRVFERLASNRPGTGIGLAILRRIAESSGGRAWIEETTGGGCRLVFELPAGEMS